MSILRVYHPPECGPNMVPLDYHECRCITGHRGVPGDHPSGIVIEPCPRCDGYRSLKAAALAHFDRRAAFTCGVKQHSLRGDCWAHPDGTVCDAGADRIRCEDCGHPMSDGTWEGEWGDDITRFSLLHKPYEAKGFHNTAERNGTVHYSPCDEGCRHGGPARARLWTTQPWSVKQDASPEELQAALKHAGVGSAVEASWRPVDVRTLSYPNILLPEHLAVLCLRCFAARGVQG